MTHPEEEGEISPAISIYEFRPRTRKELEEFRARLLSDRKEDASFKIDPVREVKVDGRTGYLVQTTFMNSLASIVHQRKTAPPPSVLTREREIFITGPARSYVMRYKAPVSLFEKHAPEFEKVVASVKFETK